MKNNMIEVSKARTTGVPISPYKLRPLANVIRGKRLDNVLSYLQTYGAQKVEPLFKTVSSAFANAQNLKNKDEEALQSKELYVQGVRVDAGTIITYFKPGSRGKS